MSEHTRGQFSVRDNDEDNRTAQLDAGLPEPTEASGWFDILDPEGRVLGSAYMRSREVNRANATLWAAAPDLLEALEDAVGDLETVIAVRGDSIDLTQYRAIIAKAKGEDQ